MSGKIKNGDIVINLCQKQEYTDNYAVGLLNDHYHEKGDDGQAIDVYEFYPRDAVRRKAAKKPQRVFLEDGVAVQIPKNTLSPRNMYWLMPMRPSEVPDTLQGTELGVFFNEFYYPMLAMKRGLQTYAEQEPQRLQELRDLTRSTMDEDLWRKLTGVLSEVEDYVNKSSSSSSSDDD